MRMFWRLPISMPPHGICQAAAEFSKCAPVFRIPTMDCPNEENDIRKALASIEGIRSLYFKLSARTACIDATAQSLEVALKAIRKAGFEPQLVNLTAEEPAAGGLSDFRRVLEELAAVAIWLSRVSTYAKELAALRCVEVS